jgi:hypothetical protein
MTSGFVPRFVLEIAFLALLALAAGLAELETQWIIAVMAVGWILVALVEWLAWRSETSERSAVRPADGEAADQRTGSWDIEEILAPVPEPEGGTDVIPPEDVARSAGGPA